MQTIYTDGVANIDFHDGVAKLELMATRQKEKDKKEMAPVCLLAMSLPAMLRVHEQLGKVIENMVEQGILKKNTPEVEKSKK